MPKKASRRAPASYEPDRIETHLLDFDEQNPRLVEHLEGGLRSQDALLEVLWSEFSVREVAMSIAASGFFDYEPIFVEVAKKGRFVVIEGNRRLAAVRVLRDPNARKRLRATDLPNLTAAAAKKLDTLPVIKTTRKDAWQYLGFKHVNGPAKWDSYAKAQYIAQVHHEFGVPLEDITSQIGDEHQTVRRLYRALMVIEQAERAAVFKRENRAKSHFSFSHLYTGLGYEGISAFLQVADESAESNTPVPKKNLSRLGELCKWLYGDKTLDVQPVVQSQNPHLRQLDEVLKTPEAVDALRADLPLSVALEIGYGDDHVFRSSLLKAKEHLQKARATLSTGFDGSDAQLLRLAEEIDQLSQDLVAEMERKSKPKRRRPKTL